MEVSILTFMGWAMISFFFWQNKFLLPNVINIDRKKIDLKYANNK
jgi:hypothetical protein